MKYSKSRLNMGTVKVTAESLDDLWYLSSLLEAGDIVRGKSYRRVKSKEESTGADKGERVAVTIEVSVEKMEFKSDAGVLRATGKITHGPDNVVALGSHHTFNIEKGTTVDVTKPKGWSRVDLDRLSEAKKSSLRPKVIIAVVEDGELFAGLVRESKIDYYDVKRSLGGKHDVKGREARKAEFYSECASLLKMLAEKDGVEGVILAGPGFEKSNLYDFLREKEPGLAGSCRTENIGSNGRSGIGEVVKRGGIEKISEDLSAARDIRLLEGLLEHIGKGSGLAAYGSDEVARAVDYGAVEMLLVTDTFFMNNRDFLRKMFGRIKDTKGGFHIMNADSDAGRQLDSLGGLGAILRFRIE